MGLGDDLMYRSEAYHTGSTVRPIKRGTPVRVLQEAWRNTPWINLKEGVEYETHPNNNRRWYSDGTPYVPKRSPWQFTQDTEAWFQQHVRIPAPGVLFGVHTKPTGFGENKRWPHWQELIDLCKDQFNILVASADGSGPKGTIPIRTSSIDRLMRVVSEMTIVVTQEGGLHHCAGQLGTPSITLYGSETSPLCTGYDTATPIVRTTPCNAHGRGHYTDKPCLHCQDAMQSITPREVYECLITHL